MTLIRMFNMKKIIKFLLLNGYVEDSEKGSEYRSFYKNGLSTIDINEKEVVLVIDYSDWLHLPVNIYAVIGALIHFRELSPAYNFVDEKIIFDPSNIIKQTQKL